MFDVGFSELCLIGLVSLLVIGPERLPKVARIAGYWLGKTRSMVASVKEEIKLELQAEEMRQIFKEQSALHDDVQQMLDETSSTIKSTFDPMPIAAKTQNDDMEPLSRDTTDRHEPK
ncbi:MAG: twin-arginine translocase subunit TatB [Methylobacter sp.]|nr:MAG: twin-arginine translocase subunit TatB [Methylobacter sp.]